MDPHPRVDCYTWGQPNCLSVWHRPADNKGHFFPGHSLFLPPGEWPTDRPTDRPTMLLRHVRHFLQETTIHGFRYLGGGTCLLEKALWSCLIALSLIACTFLILSSFREVAENPFLTSVDSVPIQDLPFPAVSVGGVDIGRGINPWMNFQRLVLDTLVFDCAVAEEGDVGNCTEKRGAAREAFKVVIDDLVDEAFDAIVRASSGESNETMELAGTMACAQAIVLYMVDGLHRMDAIAEILQEEGEEGERMAEFRELGKTVFRKSRAEAVSDIHDFIERHHDAYVPSYACSTTYAGGLSFEIVAKVLAWLVSQGSLDVPIPLGRLLDEPLAETWRFDGKPEFERLISTLLPLYEYLYPSAALRLSKPNEYLLGGLAYNGLIRLVHGWPDAEECSVFFTALNTMDNNVQEEFCRQDEACCKVEEEVTASYANVLKLMKFSLQPHTWSRREASDVADVLKGAEVWHSEIILKTN